MYEQKYSICRIIAITGSVILEGGDTPLGQEERGDDSV